MSRKTDDKIEEIERWKQKREIEQGVKEGVDKWIRTICMTATSAIIGLFYTLGSFAYTKSAAISAAIKAFLLVDKGGQ